MSRHDRLKRIPPAATWQLARRMPAACPPLIPSDTPTGA
jgi:hypothetical protein